MAQHEADCQTEKTLFFKWFPDIHMLGIQELKKKKFQKFENKINANS